jgi:hypothetical protein
MSLAIACWVRDTTLINNQKDVELNKAILASIGKSNSILNSSIKGMNNHKEIEYNNNRNTYKDFLWLLKG